MKTRKIKFRAWDKHYQSFFKNVEFLSNGYWDSSGCPVFLHECKARDYSDCEVDFSDNYVLQQYTGLKDKNNKEIYEGDILKIGDRNKEVLFDMGMFYIDKGCEELPISDIDNIVEVIGNIFENPELL